MTRLALCLLFLAVLLPASAGSGRPVAAANREAAAAEKLVLAYYYAWYDQNTWRPGTVPDMPATPYVSAERATIARQVEQSKAAGIDGLVLSWLGPNNPTDWNLATFLSVAQEKGLRGSVFVETTSPFLAGQGALASGLRYLIDKYGGQPSLLRHQGKPVFFFWHARQYPVATWQGIRAQVDPQNATVWIAEGDDASYLQAFDGITLYSVAWSANPANTLSSFAGKVDAWRSRLGAERLWVATAMPGYDDRLTGRPDAFVRDRQDGQYYVNTWNAALATAPDWIVITSFNEWVEGSQIEPSVSYGDKYLNLTKEMAARFKAVATPTARVAETLAADHDVANGHFYTQGAGGGPAGFVVSNDDGARLWDEYRRLGGVAGLGYPISQRFSWNGFAVQVMQKGVLQWRPEVGRAYLVNVFDQLSIAGKDDWLEAVRAVPRPLGGEFDGGRPWDEVVQARLALLDAAPAIRQRYLAVSDPLNVYGLPTSRVEDLGSHYAVRLQRAVIQQWKVDVPWARAGEVIVANGGDIAKEAGLYPAEVLSPRPVG